MANSVLVCWRVPHSAAASRRERREDLMDLRRHLRSRARPHERYRARICAWLVEFRMEEPLQFRREGLTAPAVDFRNWPDLLAWLCGDWSLRV